MKRDSKDNGKWIEAKPYPAAGRKTFNVMFLDPRKKNKRVNRGLGTSDPDEAKRICSDLERILNYPEHWDIKHPIIAGLRPKAVEIFFGEVPPPESILEIPVRTNYVKPFNESEIGDRFDDVVYRVVMPAELIKMRAQYEKDLLEAHQQKDDALTENVALRREAGRHVKVSLKEAILAYKDAYLKNLGDNTTRDANPVLDLFMESVGASKLIGTIRAGDVEHWLATYKNRKDPTLPVMPNTKKKLRMYVSGFLNWTYRRYDLREKITDRFGPIPGLARNPESVIAITDPKQVKILLSALEPHLYWQAWVGVAILAGPRYDEQRWLRADAVDLLNNVIRIKTRTSGRKPKGTKTGKERDIPIEQTTLRPLLNKYLASRDTKFEWLFPSTLGEGTIARTKTPPGIWSSSSNFLRELKAVLKKAKESVNGTGDFWGYGPDEWRHCFGTALGHSGFNFSEICRFMGNTSDVADRHYIAPLNVAKSWPFKWRGEWKNADSIV